MKHFGIFDTVEDVQDALNAGTFENPYVATVQGNLDYNTIEQQTCAERGLCGDDPTDCHECSCEEQYEEGSQEKCECEGRYWYADECHDEPEPGPEDPCAGMEQEYEDCINGGGVWDAGTCTCQPSDPCVEDPCSCAAPGSEEECNCQGGTWDGENCNFDDPCGDASPEECECIQQGGTWDGSHGSSEGTCNLPADDPCADAEDPAACECEQQGGTWDGSTCNMPSD